MISGSGLNSANPDLWSRLAAPLPATAINWRQDGKPISSGGRFMARFVAYIDAHFVRERLDSVVPGEWDTTLELLPTPPADDSNETCAFKCRLQILGCVREDVGEGSDYKQAATDAFKRAAVRFGIGAELYDYGPNWVRVDSDSKFAKAIEDPSEAYARRASRPAVTAGEPPARTPPVAPMVHAPSDIDERAPLDGPEPTCPTCGGRMWDNRYSKKNPKAPDWKCRDKSCEGVVWPPRAGDTEKAAFKRTLATAPAPANDPAHTDNDFPAALVDDQDDLPF